MYLPALMRRFLSVMCLLLLSYTGWGQAVPDTSMNTIVRPDTTQQAADTVAVNSDSSRILSSKMGTLSVGKPTVIMKAEPFQPNPKKSGMYSAIFPGMGQLYNRQYWKLPVIYVGVAVAGYFIQSNLNQYRTYRKAYIARIDNDPTTVDPYENLYTESDLQQLQDGYRKYLDLTVLITAAGYALQIMDAVVFAHLKNFDVSKDISMQWQPIVTPHGGAGIGLAFSFK